MTRFSYSSNQEILEVGTTLESDAPLPGILNGISLDFSIDTMLKKISPMVVGQTAALRQLTSALSCVRMGAKGVGPAALLLMVGPSGSGKSLVAEQLVSMALSDARAVKVFNMASYASEQDGFGLVGLRDGWSSAHPGKLTSFVRENPNAVIVLDNFDLAHLQVQDVLIPMLTTGWLTDEFGFYRDNDTKSVMISGPKVDFRRAVVVLTTRLGSDVYTNHALMQSVLSHPGQMQRTMLDSMANAVANMGRHAVSRALLDALINAQMLVFEKLTFWQLEGVTTKEMAAKQKMFKGSGLTILLNQSQEIAKAIVLSIGNAANAKLVTAAVNSFFMEVLALNSSANNATKVQPPIAICIGNEDQKQLQKVLDELGPVPLLELERRTQLLSFALKRARDRANPESVVIAVTEFKLGKVQSAKDYSSDVGLRSDIPNVRFVDIAGLGPIKSKLMEVAELLKSPQILKLHGLAPPRGMLMWGPPGTAKTTLAKAFAGEAGLPFIGVTGPELLDPDRTRSVFKTARKYAPSVVFIDEIDALGRRDGGAGGTAINQLLTDIDGFETRTDAPVFVIAATNLAGKVDPALLRAGRLEWVLEIPILDREGRDQFLQRFKAILISDEFNLERLLQASAGMSGAEMEQALRQTVMIAIRQRVTRVQINAVLEQFNAILHGRRRMDSEVSRENRLSVAYHEAGHALVSRILNPMRAVLEVTIAPRRSLGFVSLEDRRGSMNAIVLKAELATALAGRLSQLKRFGEAGCDTGSEADLEMATRLAYYGIGDWGMEPAFGMLSISALKQVGHNLQTNSERLERCVNEWLISAEKTANEVLNTHWAKLEVLVQALMDKETLTGEELDSILFDYVNTTTEGIVKTSFGLLSK